MRIGIVGSVLVVLGAGAAGGALFMRDQTSLQEAVAARDAGLAQAGQGELGAAQASFDKAALAAAKVGPLTGMRAEALAIADQARAASLALGALEHADSDPRRALSFLDADGGLPGLELSSELLTTLARLRADRLIDAGLALESRDDVVNAPKLFEAAVAAGEAAGSPRVAEAKQGLERAQVRRALVQAEAAVAAERDAEALEQEQAATAGIEAQAQAFPGAEAQALRERLAAVRREVSDREAVTRFEAAVKELARQVASSALGELLPQAERTAAPALQGQHPRAEALQGRLQAAQQLLDKVRQAARDFAGMVLAGRRGMTLVFIDAHEVTNEAYAAFLGQGGEREAPKTWRRGQVPEGTERQPVTAVSPEDALAFAAAQGKRLPTLDEWRQAAVRGDEPFPWGTGWKDGAANLREANVGAPRDVGSYPDGVCHCGAQDMIGNVREIVTAGDGFRAVGGSFRTDAPRSSAQEDGVELSPRTKFSDVGFRCAKELQWDG